MRLITYLLALMVTATPVAACTLVLNSVLLDADLGPEPTPVVLRSVDHVPRISVDEAKQHFDNGTAILIDSRSEMVEDSLRLRIIVLGVACTRS